METGCSPTQSLPLSWHVAVHGGSRGRIITNSEIAELTVSESENMVYIRKCGGVGIDAWEMPGRLAEQLEPADRPGGPTPEEPREAVQPFNSKVENVPGTEV